MNQIMAVHNNTTMNCSDVIQDYSYDSTGAAYFIVVTVVVYGLGIMAFIAGHISKRSVNRDEENQILQYMKKDNFVHKAEIQQSVYKTRHVLTSISLSDSYYANNNPYSASSVVSSDLSFGKTESVTSQDDIMLSSRNGKGKKVRFSESSQGTPLLREISKESGNSLFNDDVFT